MSHNALSSEDFGYGGLANRDQRWCWLTTGDLLRDRPESDPEGPRHTAADLPGTIAHEIGHVLVGPGHPDQRAGAAPLPGTNHRERLMASGNLFNHGRLLVKAEWDRCEEWLSRNPDERLRSE